MSFPQSKRPCLTPIQTKWQFFSAYSDSGICEAEGVITII